MKHLLPKPFVLLWAASVALMVGWSFAVPIFEAPDEQHHWQFARHLYEQRQLPIYDSTFVEAKSPPLYYALIAPLAAPSELPPILRWRDGLGRLVHPNPPRWFENSAEDFGKYWPIRAARLATVLLSSGTIVFAYLAGVEANGRRATGLLAAGLVGFLPQFSFRGMNVSNDALVMTLSAALLYLLIRLVRRGFTWPIAVLAGLLMAAAYLSKINAIFWPIPFALVLLSDRAPLRARVTGAAVAIGMALLLVAPWSIRNQILYGDPFANRVMWAVEDYIVDFKPLTSPYFLTTFPTVLFQSTIGLFGWMNVPLPTLVYGLFGLLGVGGALGFLKLAPCRELDRRLLLLLVTVPLLSLLVVIYINLSFTQPQGRYLFPALTAISLILALGIEALPRWDRRALPALLGALFLVNVFSLTQVVIPSYWPPVVTHVPTADTEWRFNATTKQAGELHIETDLLAGQYAFLQLTLSGDCRGQDVQGRISFDGSDPAAGEREQKTFDWKADGKERVVTLALYQEPAWRGRITALGLTPFAGGDSACRGTAKITAARLRGRLD